MQIADSRSEELWYPATMLRFPVDTVFPFQGGGGGIITYQTAVFQTWQ